MTETKHTPGPWVYTLTRGANPKLAISNSAGGAVALTKELSRHPMAKQDNDVILANARLIAAAPELLHALECLLHPMAGTEEDIDYAREVIAKARGREWMTDDEADG